MTAGEYCNREITIIGPESSITEAARLMRQHHVGMLVVVEREGEINRPIGVITDRDLVIEVLAQEVAINSVTVRDVMSQDPVQVGEGDTLLDTIELMQSRGVRRIMVVDDEGSLQGLMSADDAIELIAEAMGNLTKVVRHELSNEQKAHP
jgi:CBS domain-containing protein